MWSRLLTFSFNRVFVFQTRVFSPSLCLGWTSIWSYCHLRNGRLFVDHPRAAVLCEHFCCCNCKLQFFCASLGCADFGMAGGRKSGTGQIYLRKSGWPVLSLSNTTRTSVIRTSSKENGKKMPELLTHALNQQLHLNKMLYWFFIQKQLFTDFPILRVWFHSHPIPK